MSRKRQSKEQRDEERSLKLMQDLVDYFDYDNPAEKIKKSFLGSNVLEVIPRKKRDKKWRRSSDRER